ncbi:MAG: NAD(P)-binding domain-containing protein, partial [Methylotenera sp.]|nr:NAD(P)-binding domain-containing protein [Methylotenera sp.]
MKLAMIGLGKMGGNMATRLLRHKIEVVGFDFNADTVNKLAKEEGLIAAGSVADAVSKLSGQKIVWMMLPAGDITENQIKDLIPILNKGDIIIDGGNS